MHILPIDAKEGRVGPRAHMQLVKSRGFKNMFQMCDSELEWLLGAMIGADADENNQVLKLMFS